MDDPGEPIENPTRWRGAVLLAPGAALLLTLGAISVSSLRAGTSLGILALWTALLALGVQAAMVAPHQQSRVRVILGLLALGLIEFAAAWPGVVPTLLLGGMGAGGLACWFHVLLGLGAVAWVVGSGVRRGLALLVAAPILYGTLEFLPGLTGRYSLDEIVVGAGLPAALRDGGIPVVIRPVWIGFNIVLPLLGLGLLAAAAREGARGAGDRVRRFALLALVALVPTLAGQRVCRRYGIPCLGSAILGRSVGSGRVRVQILDPGQIDRVRTLELATRDHREGREADLVLDVGLPRTRDGRSVMRISAKHAATGLDLAHLADGDLRVRIDGREVAGATVASRPPPPPGGASITLMLDISGSMEGAIEELKEVAGIFVDRVAARHQLALGEFAGITVMRVPLTRDRSELKKSIQDLYVNPIGGGTAFYDAVAHGLENLRNIRGEKALIVFTDGSDTSSKLDLDAILARLWSGDTPVHTVGLGEDLIKQGGDHILRRVAMTSGGGYYHARNVDALVGAFDSVYNLLSARHQISFPAPSGQPGP